ncbi:MAG: coproporphyrinogen-III oxidase family protein [Elusimicrobia bacterium]|nr:coproporphyrinogen-III oxidase family protein [Elusimicrobiota bacterium]
MPDASLRGVFKNMDAQTFPEYPVHYPPPAAWTQSVKPAQLLDAWRRSLQGPDQDLVLYAHVPFCRGLCRFCGFLAQTLRNGCELDRYLDSLQAELSLYAPIFAGRRFTWLCVGGGTPSLLSAAQIRRFFGMFQRHFRLSPGCRIAFESHPDSLDPAKLSALKECGVDWLAIGVQSFDAGVLRRNGRPQDNSRLGALVTEARGLGIGHIQLDLIAGLPSQTRKIFLRDVEKAVALGPDRLYLFPFQEKVRVRGTPAPEPDWLRPAYRLALERLVGSGYEISCGRWVYKGSGGDWPYSYDQGEAPSGKPYSILGVGPGAISYARGTARYQNLADFTAYRRALALGRPAVGRQFLLAPRDEMINFVILRLLHHGECSAREFSRLFRRSLPGEFGPQLAALTAAGHLRRIRGKYYLPDREAGLFHIRKTFFAPEILEKLRSAYGRAGAAQARPAPARAPELRLGNGGLDELRRRIFSARRQGGCAALVFPGGKLPPSPTLPGLLRLAKRLGYSAVILEADATLPWARAAAAIAPALARARRAGVRVTIRGLPPCAKPEWLPCMENDAPAGRVKPAACIDCCLQTRCPGVDAGYIARFGERNIRPVRTAGSA